MWLDGLKKSTSSLYFKLRSRNLVSYFVVKHCYIPPLYTCICPLRIFEEGIIVLERRRGERKEQERNKKGGVWEERRREAGRGNGGAGRCMEEEEIEEVC